MKAGNASGLRSLIMISHFHPDHVWGLMEKGTNNPVFPNAKLVVNSVEYKWWTDPSRVEQLPAYTAISSLSAPRFIIVRWKRLEFPWKRQRIPSVFHSMQYTKLAGSDIVNAR